MLAPPPRTQARHPVGVGNHAARDAIFNLERALDSALADARNTIRQATEPTT